MRPKQYVDTVNIYYSPSISKWNVCALLTCDNNLLKRKKFVAESFDECLKYVSDNFTSDLPAKVEAYPKFIFKPVPPSVSLMREMDKDSELSPWQYEVLKNINADMRVLRDRRNMMLLKMNSTYGKVGSVSPRVASNDLHKRFEVIGDIPPHLNRKYNAERHDHIRRLLNYKGDNEVNENKHDLTTRRGILMALASGEKLCCDGYPPNEYVWMDECGRILTEHNESFILSPRDTSKFKIWTAPKPKRKLYLWVVQYTSSDGYFQSVDYFTDEEANKKFGDRVVARLDNTMIEVE